MTLNIFDSATGGMRPLVTLDRDQVKIYVCGLTVQSEPHVGHMRSAVNFDVLRRWLLAKNYDVTFIRNVTDVDDKIFAKAAEQQRPWYNLAYDMRRELDRLLTLLNVMPPTYEPAATGHVPEVLALIDELMTAGHAYESLDGTGDVYFDVTSWHAYGELTRQRLADLKPADDKDQPGKRDPRDFTLWKSRKSTDPDTAAWPSRFGPGRPGWHIGCSAMARKYLGPSFDIHGGGVDLRFPHHENEQAQSRAAGSSFATYWMHNAWVTAAGEKMSKSLNNSMHVPEVLQHVRPVDLRYYLVSAHYRSTVEFTLGAVLEAATALRRIESFLHNAPVDAPQAAAALPERFTAAMNRDLETPAAVAVLHQTVRAGNRLLPAGPTLELQERVGEVRAMLDVLGLNLDLDTPAAGDPQDGQTAKVLIDGLLAERGLARLERDWPRADRIRDLLRAADVDVQDTGSANTL